VQVSFKLNRMFYLDSKLKKENSEEEAEVSELELEEVKHLKEERDKEEINISRLLSQNSQLYERLETKST